MRRLFVILLATLIVAGSSYIASALSAPDQPSLSYVGRLPDGNELDRLIGVFEDRIEEHPSSIDARSLGAYYLQRATLTGNLHDFRSANASYQTAADLAPTDTAVQLGLATSQAYLHEFRSSLATAEELVAVQPENWSAWVTIGDARLELGDIAGAEDAFSRAPSGQPATIVRQAELAHIGGDQDRAIHLASEATDLALKSKLTGRALMFYQLHEADLLFDAGRYVEAATLIEQAIDVDPSWAIAHASQGKTLAALGQSTAAKVAFEAALELQAGDPGWLTALGDLALRRGDVTASEDFYAEAEQIMRGETETLYGRSLAGLFADRDINHTEAVRLAREDVERRPGIGAWDTYAWTLYRAGDYEAARTAADKAGEYGTQDGELIYHSAVIWLALGDTEKGAEQLRALLDVNPRFHLLHADKAASLLDSLDS